MSMKYSDGQMIEDGDWVRVTGKSIWKGCEGTVIDVAKFIPVEIELGNGNSEFRKFRPHELELVNRLH